MKKPTVVVTTVLLANFLFAAATPGKRPRISTVRLPAVAVAAMQSINPDRIRAHVRFLASDLLEGRGTGQRGGDIAAEYLATQFALYGLKPAGENQSYLQRVPMAGVTTQPESTFSLVPANGQAIALKLLDDIVASNQTEQPESDLNADLVYVGYGIEAPEYKWDDYKGVDVKGKVLLMLVNEPPSDDPKFFKAKALTYYGRWTYKYEEAARKGAAGVILIHKTEMASYGWDVVRNSWSGESAYLKAEAAPKLTMASWIQLDVARRLAGSLGMGLDKMLSDAQSRDFHPVPLAVKLQAHIVSKIRTFESNNVIAMLPGANPRLRTEAVMYTAHYDHLGIVPGQQGDNIYNGANDNATGCGILLEIARAYAAAAQKPPRSIFFAAVTGEEKGLLGSEYLGKHPPNPAGKISLDLNFDDVPPLGAPEETEVSGSERTTFYPVVQSTAKDFKLAIRPDARPEAGHYYRSDHFSMARVGVPSFSLNEGMKYHGHDQNWGMKQAEDYTAKHYHQPSDEYRSDMDFTGDAAIARFGFALGWKAAILPQLVGWEKGDEFEAARLKSQGGE
ncbi:MAG TPA: M28 family metallopeptidase [Terriglobales bacterium]|jgi:Zn-dependent M28 family amino/carboxypeptidase